MGYIPLPRKPPLTGTSGNTYYIGYVYSIPIYHIGYLYKIPTEGVDRNFGKMYDVHISILQE
jgi:hypothetical protein